MFNTSSVDWLTAIKVSADAHEFLFRQNLLANHEDDD